MRRPGCRGQPPCANCPLLTADRTLADCPPLTNRINAVIEHIPWYGFRTQVRLAHDSQVSEAAISRLLRGESQPSLVVALQVTQAIARRLQRHIDVCELFSLDGSFPTASVCALVGCRNCLPECFYDERENLKPQFRDARPGQWELNQPHKSTKSCLMLAGSVGAGSAGGR